MGGWASISSVAAVVASLCWAAARRGAGTGFAAGAAALVATFAGFIAYGDHTLQVRLAAAGESAGGVAVSVQCPDPFIGEFLWTPGEGHVRFDAAGNPDGVARLDGWVCSELSGWPSNHTEDRARVAVHVLTHEVAHLRGELNEAAAECWAVQHSSIVGEGLGAGPAEAAAARAWYIAEQLPRMRGPYRDPQRCRAGGEWDVGLGAFDAP